MPFVLQGIWVDLPWRLKFLRLTSGQSSKRDRRKLTTTVFVASSIKSMVVLILIYFWNVNQIRDTWETGSTPGSIVCSKRVSKACMAELNYRESSLASCINASATCIACPSDLDFSSGFAAFNDASAAERRVLRETTWWRGACWHDPGKNRENATVAVSGNTSSTMAVTTSTGYACIPEMRGVNGRPVAGHNHVSFLHIPGISCVLQSLSLQIQHSVLTSLHHHNQINMDFWRVMRVAHGMQTAHNNGEAAWLVVTFWVLLTSKALLTVLVWQQFTCTRRGYEGRFECCCGESVPRHPQDDAEKDSKSRGFSHHDSRSNASAVNQLKAFAKKERRLWKSELRVRDVQLLLRVGTIMPKREASMRATEDDCLSVECAKFVLGSGGSSLFQEDKVTDSMVVMMSSGGLSEHSGRGAGAGGGGAGGGGADSVSASEEGKSYSGSTNVVNPLTNSSKKWSKVKQMMKKEGRLPSRRMLQQMGHSQSSTNSVSA